MQNATKDKYFTEEQSRNQGTGKVCEIVQCQLVNTQYPDRY